MSIFTSVQTNKPKRNKFEMPHDRKFSCDMGQLVPIFVQDVLPGDSWAIQTEQMLRLAPMVAPVMHKVDVYVHYFFVPNRIVWKNWEDFITGGEDGESTAIAPYAIMPEVVQGSIGDYMGLPVGIAEGGADPITVNALPLAAYYKIYDEYYRSETLQEKQFAPLEDGNNSPAYAGCGTSKPLMRGWQHDYFTSALSEPQKGPEAIIPIAGTAQVKFDATGEGADNNYLYNLGAPTPTKVASTGITADIASGLKYDGVNNAQIDNSASLYVDLNTATAVTINDLREAQMLQRWLELNSRGGSRYIETIMVHFGVKSSDARLQRPEYLGGGRSNLIISEVLQMSESDTTPQGNMAGHGINLGESRPVNRFFEEHGFIIGIMSVMPKTAYQQGLPKMYQKFDKLDYYWPSFAHLGEQEIKNREIFAWASAEEQEGTFGYIPRYAEYKNIPSSVHGEMTTSLNFWHMGRIFEQVPALNGTFIESDPTNRIFAVDTEADHVYVHMMHRVYAKRPMPYYGTPM